MVGDAEELDLTHEALERLDLRMDEVKKTRGFAVMDSAKRREIAKKGGIAAHAGGTAHKFTQEEAREAGRKGGLACAKRKAEAAAREDKESDVPG